MRCVAIAASVCAACVCKIKGKFFIMETRLQSSEVRIPKNERGNQPANVSAFKSSFARSLSFSCQNKPLDLENGFRVAAPNLDITSPNLINLKTSPLKDDDFEEFMKHSPLKRILTAKQQQQMVTPIKGRQMLSLSADRQRMQVKIGFRCTVTLNNGLSIWDEILFFGNLRDIFFLHVGKLLSKYVRACLL